MLPKEAQNIVNSWIKEIAETLPPHHKVLPESARAAIVAETLTKRFEEALAKDGHNKEVLGLYLAHTVVLEEMEQMQPRGQYDPEALLSLDGNMCVMMAKATKKHVQQWRDYIAKDLEKSYNYGNVMYADARLALWGEEKTLAELEGS